MHKIVHTVYLEIFIRFVPNMMPRFAFVRPIINLNFSRIRVHVCELQHFLLSVQKKKESEENFSKV